MDHILKKFIGVCCFDYEDDIIVFGKTKKEHDVIVKNRKDTNKT